jgi:hypothetical protein
MPILCAAVCTYIVSAIAIRIQRKYAAPKENVTRASSP